MILASTFLTYGVLWFTLGGTISIDNSKSSSSRLPAVENCLGINFGRNFITSSVFVGENDPKLMTVARLFASPEYREYMTEAFEGQGQRIKILGEWYLRNGDGALVEASPEIHDSLRVERIFAQAVTDIKKASQKALGKSISIGAAAFPQYFNDTTFKSMLKGAGEAEPHLKEEWRFKKFLSAVRLAYGLNSCESWGLTDDGCDTEDGPHLAIFINFENSDNLEFVAADIGKYGSYPFYKKHLKDLKNSQLLDSEVTEGQIMEQSLYLDERQARKIRKGFKGFLTATVAMGARESLLSRFFAQATAFLRQQSRPHKRYFSIDDIHAVLISGEASENVMDRIRKIVQDVLPMQLKVKVRDSINASFVGAAGAAFQARIFKLEPHSMDEPVLETWHPEQHSREIDNHDEL
ncbi:hypothetical protein BGZ60DRAFT_570014 [Tricladium varicosporioides]|nr:hypothetical protein BGZ60DRAFT_570014 [Hymenoscyphus varicosporioides]